MSRLTSNLSTGRLLAILRIYIVYDFAASIAAVFHWGFLNVKKNSVINSSSSHAF